MIREVAGVAPNERVWESERGRLTIREVAPAVTLFIEQGFLDAGFADLVKAGNDAALARHPRPYLFVDAENLEGYDPQIQTSATQWVKENKARITIQHMLVRSRLTRLGLSVASLALGGVVKGHNSRLGFEATLQQAVSATASTPAKAG